MNQERSLQLPGQRWTDLLADRLYVPDQKRHVAIQQSDIMLVKGARSSVELTLTDGKRRTVSTHLSQFRSYLNQALFVQVSRSYIVNLLHTDSVGPGSVEVNNVRISVTSSYRAGINERLNLVRLRSEDQSAGSPQPGANWEVDSPTR